MNILMMDTTSDSPRSTPSIALANHLSPSFRPLTKENSDTLCLERLTYDVRRLILSSVYTIADLSALIRASPVFYRDYAVDPEKWLYGCLKLELGPTIVDAFNVHLSSTIASRQDHTLDNRSRTLDNIRQLISSHRSRNSASIGVKSVLPSKAEILSMVAFHSTVMMPLVSRFIEWTQRHFEALSLPDGLSHTESKRILRGFYRYQLFCKVFGPNGQTIQPFVSADYKLEWFFSLYEPWEREEILCVHEFVNDKYQRVLDGTGLQAAIVNVLRPGISWDMGMPMNISAVDYTGTTIDIRTLGDITFHDEAQFFKPGLSSLGLTLLLSMLNAADSRTLVSLVLQNISRAFTPWVTETVSSSCQYRRRRGKRVDSARDKAQAERQPMPFTGDSEGSPPLAWVTIWKGTYSNLFGEWMPRSFLRWGYVMWDSDRMISAGAGAVLEDKWNKKFTTQFGDSFVDPRDRV